MDNGKKPVLFIDGECYLCHGLAKFIIKRDKKDVFRIAYLQSDLFKKVEKESGQLNKPFALNTVILFDQGQLYDRSNAALRVLKYLGGGWKILSFILKLIPRVIRDFFYNIIAKYRYKIWGRADACIIPNERIRGKFLE